MPPLPVLVIAIVALVQGLSHAQGPLSRNWAEAGLHLRIVDTLAFLDSVGGFRIRPALTFPARRIEARSGAPLSCLPHLGVDGLDSAESLLSWGSEGPLTFRVDRRRVRLDPAAGSLSFGKLVAVVPSQSISSLPSSSSLPRNPVAALWERGRWSVAPRVGKGAGALFVPVHFGRQLAAFRIDRASWSEGGWDLGSGPHLLEWIDEPSRGRKDTLKGELRLVQVDSDPERTPAGVDSLDPGPNTMYGIGGIGGGGRYDQEENRRELRRLSALVTLERRARGLALAGRANWIAGGVGVWQNRWTTSAKLVPLAGVFENGTLRQDTARLPSGTRVLDATIRPDGAPIHGILLDFESVKVRGGKLVFGPGVRLVKGLPALGGQGTRRLVLYLPEEMRRSDGYDTSRLSQLELTGAGTSSRSARTGRFLSFRDGRLVVAGLIGVERKEDHDGEGRELPDRFVVVLDSLSVRLPGMTDTAGKLAEVVLPHLGSQDLFPDPDGSTSWPILGPWRQWSDSARPWLVWRFRSALGRGPDGFTLQTQDLRVGWKGSTFRSTQAQEKRSRASYVFTSAGFRCIDARRCRRIALPVPPGRITGSPWVGLGRFAPDSTVDLLDTTLTVPTRLTPSSGWARLFGKAPVRADIQASPVVSLDGTWSLRLGDRPALSIHMADSPLPHLGTRFLIPEDTLLLTSAEGALRFKRRWDEPVLEGPVVLGFPENADDQRSLLRELDWTGDDRGELDIVRERWEALARPQATTLHDGSRLQGIEPLQVFLTRKGSVLGKEVRAKGLMRVARGKAFPVPLDTLAHLDGKDRPLDAASRRTVPPPAVHEASGRVRVTLEDGTVLKVDRTEVPRGRWDECVAAGACQATPDDSCHPISGIDDRRDSLRFRRSRAWRRLPEMPATCVGISQARDFCAWADGRLPSMGEFRRIAATALADSRGAGDAHWPANTWWNGDGWEPGGDDPYPDLAPVGNLRALPPGLHDLVGNAAEWCIEPESRDSYQHDIRCTTEPKGFRVKPRREESVGFRCVED